MKEKTDYSGNFRVRIPKSLHAKLAEDAKGEGTSLNQYIVYLLSKNIQYNFFNSKDLNKKLLRIKEEVGLEDLVGLELRIKNLREMVNEVKPSIIRKIKENRSLPKNLEIELVDKYPLMSGDIVGEKYPFIKKPTIKVVLEDSKSQFSDVKEILEKECPSAKLSEINIDELNDTFNLEIKIGNKDLNSKVIYFDDKNLDDLIKMVQTISNILKEKGEKIKFYPSYVWERLEL